MAWDSEEVTYVSNVVGILAQYQVQPFNSDWKALVRLLKYLNGTKNKGIVYRKYPNTITRVSGGKYFLNHSDIQLVCYADSNYAEGSADRLSRSGIMFLLYGSAVAWISKKQTTVASSSTEAEIYALSEATKLSLWFLQIMEASHITGQDYVLIKQDNESTIKIAENPLHTNRVKHVDVVARPHAGRWTVSNVDESHNHPLPSNIGGYSTAQKLTAVKKPVVQALAEAGSSNSTILTYLKNNHDFLAGQFSIQALFETVSAGDFIYDLKVDAAGSVTGLFFTHQTSANLARWFSSTFVMDCTYKTNCFGMPLLNIIGITATFESFNAGFAFLCDETEAEYTWALKAFSVVVAPAVIVPTMNCH
ncbi:hypothetical protein CcCBS67573_g03004 [Chytriomyces confervae]|uniref:MULE transposase domain-containing protein n=1 Tax=Chytriomyces confervae TaxID=246404 RepID=A0A507FJY7_9FUNG|nr:hypothetical protein CcCBS67573_g03004 [Chytriomyces confervae]